MMEDFTDEGFNEVKDWCKDIATQVNNLDLNVFDRIAAAITIVMAIEI